MQQIPDFTESELWKVKTTLQERYGEVVDTQIVDTEIRLAQMNRELAPCPAVYWEKDKCHLLVIKSGERSYRAQFFYNAYTQFGTGFKDFDDVSDCIVTLLQVHADHLTEKQKEEQEKEK